jgi:hypothetical protein
LVALHDQVVRRLFVPLDVVRRILHVLLQVLIHLVYEVHFHGIHLCEVHNLQFEVLLLQLMVVLLVLMSELQLFQLLL